MSAQFVTGDLFDFAANPHYAIGHGVNCVGVMGAGVAVLFRDRFPEMARFYKCYCERGCLTPSAILPWVAGDGTMILNLASQDAPGPTARYEWLGRSVFQGALYAQAHGRTLVIPRIGSGIGGLEETDCERVFDTIGQSCPLIVISLP